MRTRREMMRQAGTAAILATTSPWWLVRRTHAARQAKLVVWVGTALAPQVDKILQEQCYAYAKQAGIKESEIDYIIIGAGQLAPKLVASLEAGNPPDITMLGPGLASFYSSQGHLLEVTDLVEQMQHAYSTAKLPPMPGEACRRCHGKAATDATAKLPPHRGYGAETMPGAPLGLLGLSLPQREEQRPAQR